MVSAGSSGGTETLRRLWLESLDEDAQLHRFASGYEPVPSWKSSLNIDQKISGCLMSESHPVVVLCISCGMGACQCYAADLSVHEDGREFNQLAADP